MSPSAGRPDLAVRVGELQFRNPFLLPSAQASRTGSMLRRAFAAGWAGAVTQTITADPAATVNVAPRLLGYRIGGELSGLLNIELTSPRPLAVWRRDIADLKKEFPDRPLLASIAGASRDEWQALAWKCAEAGADGLELNVSIPHGLTEQGGGAAIGVSPDATARVTEWVVDATRLPVWVKLTPEAADIRAVGEAAAAAGASALTAVNNVRGLPGFDIETLRPRLSVNGLTTYGGYAGPALKPIVLRCVAELASVVPPVPVVACGSTSNWQDAVESLLWGATAIQVYTAVLERGYGIIGELLEGLSRYLERHERSRLAEIQRLALQALRPHSALSREHRVQARNDETRCVRCGLCAVACQDAGYQAIALQPSGFPLVDSARCVGCGLCAAICPAGSISMVEARAPVARAP
jgi:dihydropyrimidine dehydrogenase (NAD+) subunit PreA